MPIPGLGDGISRAVTAGLIIQIYNHEKITLLHSFAFTLRGSRDVVSRVPKPLYHVAVAEPPTLL